jgi:hypothetical protein
MYRVALILNESELLVSGYANLTPQVQSLPLLQDYEFDTYTSVNIGNFFDKLQFYDSVLVATNATSDRVVLECLRKNKDRMGAYLATGKGLVVLSQKKLSIKANAEAAENTISGFLPESVDFTTVERPAEETDSGQGDVSIVPEGAHHVVLVHPNNVSADSINTQCSENPFRRHFYRSTVRPIASSAYIPLLADSTTDLVTRRDLLMAASLPSVSGRVIVTTIALDWAFHKDLLTNVIVYVTEGSPRIAFLEKAGEPNQEFGYLTATARLSKIPSVTYDCVNTIPGQMRELLQIFIFAPSWAPKEVAAIIKQDKQMYGKQVHRRYYFFDCIEGVMTLSHHSTCSTIDLLIQRSVYWLDSRYKSGFWNDSFWVSHDVMRMMLDADLSVGGYVRPFLNELVRHLKDGSYDGVMGATCGMIRIIGGLWKNYRSECEEAGFGEDKIGESVRWMLANVYTQSDQDRFSVFIAIHELRGVGLYLREIDRIEALTEDILRILNRLSVDESAEGEIALCRYLESAIICCGASDEKVPWLLDALERLQSPNGSWGNIGRTAHVLLIILTNWDQLRINSMPSGLKNKVESMIYRGTLYLRGRFNWGKGSWEDDVQATAKATHAIGIHNRIFSYSTQDFLHALGLENDKIESTHLLSIQATTIGQLRDTAHASKGFQSNLTVAEKRVKTMILQLRIWQPIAVCSLLMLIALLSHLYLKQRQALKDTLDAIGIVPMVFGAVFGLVLGWFASLAQNAKSEDK